MFKIKGKIKGELDIKRFYPEGLTIIQTCPKCNHKEEYDQYLSYPEINKEIELAACCPECFHEWEEKAILEIKLKLLREKQ